jgi:outer membrane usher protein FimD/PapC
MNGSIQRAVGQTELGMDAGFARDVETSVIRAGARVLGAFGSANGDVQHDLKSGTTQFSANFRTGIAITPKAVAWGGREITDSGVIVSVDGAASDGTFEVLVDDAPKGQLGAGGRLPIFLTPYREYSVRIRPVSGPGLAFDSSPRRVSLYPGNVEPLVWQVERVFTAFGRAVHPDGSPAANAEVSSPRGIGRTDAQGFFQIDTGVDDVATLRWGGQQECSIKLTSDRPKADYVSLGTVICK